MTKQDLLEMVQALPDEVSIEDFIADLEFRAKVDERLAALDRGESVSHEEALARLHKWHQK
jgi:predicted transcriptional regulator